EHTDSHGRLEELIARACELRPQNRGLDSVVRTHWPDVPRPASPDSAPVIGPAIGPAPRRETTLSPNDWQHLVRFIREKKCTPVIGPGVCHGVLPEHVELATEWADQFRYPFADRTDLARVSQFLALTEYRLLPHEQIHQRNAQARRPDFADREEPHALLADL